MTNIAKMLKDCKPFQIVVVFVGLCLCITVANGFNQRAKEANDAVRCIEREREALVRLRESLIDEGGRLSSWDVRSNQQDCCLWQGVGCSNTTGHVIILDLHGPSNIYDDDSDFFSRLPLRGEISPSLLELQHLRYLDLSGNDFRGKLFPNINGSLTLSKLTYLDLHDTALRFTNLYQLGNLSKLQFLDLNVYRDRISNLGWLHSLSSLRHLHLSQYNLTYANDWPQLLNKLPYLEDLKLSHCSLPIILSPPNSLGNSTSSTPLSIDLSGNDLTSAMFSLFTNITSRIVDLNLALTELEGPIPSIFKNMVSLEHLDLSRNQLGGEIPEFIGNICTLKTLDLFWNNLSRVVPGLSGCIQNSLEILSLSRNPIQDSLILSHVTRYSSLKELDLAGNRLNGSFPIGFKHPSKLVSLGLSSNQLTGSLPDISNLSSLKYLYISYNRFNGTMPESLGSLSQLEDLDASWNSLEGVITEAHLQNLSKLQVLDLSNNLLTFDVSFRWVPPFQLKKIYLSFCKLGPQFPKWLQNQKNFQRLDISAARISHPIPDWFWDLSPYLLSLNLSHNHMSGMLPADLTSIKFRTFPGIDLSSNLFEGPLPIFPSNVSSLNLAKNRFSGPVSPFCKINTKALAFLDLSDNMLSGALPACFFHLQILAVLNLANNKFSGIIPINVGSLFSLGTINLHNNSFFVEFPSLKNCTGLKFLDLSQNMFSGSIPVWIGQKLSSLIYFSIQANEFNGRIPATLCRLTMLRILDLSQNNLSGAIPLCLGNLTTMIQKGDPYDDIIGHYYQASSIWYVGSMGEYIDKAWVGWKGKKYLYDSSLGLFRIIDLASNKLVGEIPGEITRLSELVVLNLSGNSFMGFIPKNIGQLKQLQSLDLLSNHLSGGIPDSMAELHFLSYLNLSYNNLSGKIPTGTQLQTMDASAFTSNQALCGSPTTQQCPKMFQDQQPDAHNKKEDRDEFMSCLYAGMGIGFFSAFSGVWGALLVKRSWRHAYFRLVDSWKDSLYVAFMLLRARLQRIFKN